MHRMDSAPWGKPQNKATHVINGINEGKPERLNQFSSLHSTDKGTTFGEMLLSEVQEVCGHDFLSHSSMNTGLCDYPEEKAFVCRSTSLPASSQDICWHICHRTMVCQVFSAAGLFPWLQPWSSAAEGIHSTTTSLGTTSQDWIHGSSSNKIFWSYAMGRGDH